MMKRMPKMQNHPLQCNGGIDTDTDPFKVRPGFLQDAQNAYQTYRGYKLPYGYERFDGQSLPSSVSHVVIIFEPVAAVNVGDTLICQYGFMDTPVYSQTDAVGQVIAVGQEHVALANVSGTFDDGELFVGSTHVGRYDGEGSVTITTAMNARYKALAADVQRQNILAPAGTSACLGIHYYDGVWYCWRDDGTNTKMFKATSGGWVEVSLGKELAFINGQNGISEGDTITDGTATATVERVVIEDGTFLGSDAYGKLIVSNQSGTFSAGTISVGASTVATIGGDSSDITLTANGRVEAKNMNFTGDEDTYRMYGCDGINRPFEFDGSIYVPITAWDDRYPKHIAKHHNHLFLTAGYSILSSETGLPYRFASILGTGDEMAMGDEVTGMMPQLGSEDQPAMMIHTRNSNAILYGTGPGNYNLIHNAESKAGGVHYSMFMAGNTFSLDDRGISKFTTTMQYGNFKDATVSQHFHTWLKDRISQLTASCVIPSENLVFYFFADKTGLALTIDNGEIVAAIPWVFKEKITCAAAAKNTSGQQEVMLGGESGMVYKLFSGTSADGDEFESYLKFARDNFGNESVTKNYKFLTLEIRGEGYSECGVLNQPNEDIQQLTEYHEIASGTLQYDSGLSYDSGLNYDAETEFLSVSELHGSGTHSVTTITRLGSHLGPIEINGGFYQFTVGRSTRYA